MELRAAASGELSKNPRCERLFQRQSVFRLVGGARISNRPPPKPMRMKKAWSYTCKKRAVYDEASDGDSDWSCEFGGSDNDD